MDFQTGKIIVCIDLTDITCAACGISHRPRAMDNVFNQC